MVQRTENNTLINFSGKNKSLQKAMIKTDLFRENKEDIDKDMCK